MLTQGRRAPRLVPGAGLWSLPVLLALVWLGWRVRCPRRPLLPPSGSSGLTALAPRLAADRLLGIINSGYGIVVPGWPPPTWRWGGSPPAGEASWWPGWPRPRP